MKASIVSVLHISTHIMYISCIKLQLLICYAKQAGFKNLALRCHSCLHKIYGTMPKSVATAPGTWYSVSATIADHTEAGCINVVTPVYQLTVSPPAASKQHHRQGQVINGKKYLHM
jgi:hypothetical protein